MFVIQNTTTIQKSGQQYMHQQRMGDAEEKKGFVLPSGAKYQQNYSAIPQENQPHGRSGKDNQWILS